jgi:glycosyltransferase involved in cell wall biosynthesis
MKIAIMMRAMDQESGHHAIMEVLIDAMLRIDHENTYLLLYRTTKRIGQFSDFPNANELLVQASHKFLWDQVAVPYIAWKQRADIIYNPKFSVPLISHCPVVMGLHEPAWWAWPAHYEWFDRNYMKLMLPIYMRKSRHLFPISQFVIDETRKYLKVPFENKTTVAYPAPKAYFCPIKDVSALENFRYRYKLPEKFILTITRVDHPGLDKSTSFFPGKNVETTIRAFMICQSNVPHSLVVAGRRVRDYLLHTGFKEADFERIHFTDFVPHEELPKLFSLADLFVIPSFYESYAMALVEAMACGCPIIASQTGACPEITAGAALLADPNDPADFSDKIQLVLTNKELRMDLRAKSLERTAFFSGEQAARLVLDAMGQVVQRSKNPYPSICKSRAPVTLRRTRE